MEWFFKGTASSKYPWMGGSGLELEEILKA